MAGLFLYGTLRHMPLLSIVLGRPAATLALVPGRLADHAVRWAEGQPFPLILPEPGASAPGLLIEDPAAEDLARLDFYEGGFDYALRYVGIDTDAGPRPARVYFPEAGRWPAGALWSLPEWQQRWAMLSCRAAQEAMSYYGRKSARDVARMVPMIRMRATAWVNARRAPSRSPGSGMTDADVQSVTRHVPHADHYVLEQHELRHRRFDGSLTPVLQREVFVGTDAAVVLPYDPVRDRVLLVEQFRPGPHARGDRQPWCLEPVAGRVDPGEDPQDTARRETREEAGLELGALERIAACYPSPGTSAEFHHIYLGLADLPDGIAGQGGLDAEDEDIRTHLLPFERFMALVESGQMNDSPTVLSAYWLARHRDRLRKGG